MDKNRVFIKINIVQRCVYYSSKIYAFCFFAFARCRPYIICVKIFEYKTTVYPSVLKIIIVEIDPHNTNIILYGFNPKRTRRRS